MPLVASLAAGSMLLALLLPLTGCAGSATGPTAEVTGTATWRERMLLPPDAVLEATLEDVSRADARAEVIGSARITAPGAPPVRFTIGYDPGRIQPQSRYHVRVKVVQGDRLLFTTDAAYPVLQPGGPTHVDVLLRRVGAP